MANPTLEQRIAAEIGQDYILVTEGREFKSRVMAKSPADAPFLTTFGAPVFLLSMAWRFFRSDGAQSAVSGQAAFVGEHKRAFVWGGVALAVAAAVAVGGYLAKEPIKEWFDARAERAAAAEEQAQLLEEFEARGLDASLTEAQQLLTAVQSSASVWGVTTQQAYELTQSDVCRRKQYLPLAIELRKTDFRGWCADSEQTIQLNSGLIVDLNNQIQTIMDVEITDEEKARFAEALKKTGWRKDVDYSVGSLLYAVTPNLEFEVSNDFLERSIREYREFVGRYGEESLATLAAAEVAPAPAETEAEAVQLQVVEAAPEPVSVVEAVPVEAEAPAAAEAEPEPAPAPEVKVAPEQSEACIAAKAAHKEYAASVESIRDLIRQRGAAEFRGMAAHYKVKLSVSTSSEDACAKSLSKLEQQLQEQRKVLRKYGVSSRGA